MAGWTELERELTRWAEAGRGATFWWRDDDAVQPTPALDRLLSVSGAAGVTVHLAVIPARAGSALADRLRGCGSLVVLQHGYAHVNHAARGEKKTELGAGRPRDRSLAELAQGWRRLARLMPGPLQPVLVPPWNRIDAALAAELPALGFATISTFGPRPRRAPAPGLRQVNTHVDVIDWRGTRGFIGREQVLDQVLRHLRARRTAAVDCSEPTGLLTHHLVHDAACWRFLRRFVARLQEHPAARWVEIG